MSTHAGDGAGPAVQSPIMLSRFPDLNSEKIAVDVQVGSELVLQLPCARLPLEILLLSWAHLLRAYTDDDAPAFLLDDEAVQADLAAGNVSKTATGPVDEQVAYSVIHTTEVCVAVRLRRRRRIVLMDVLPDTSPCQCRCAGYIPRVARPAPPPVCERRATETTPPYQRLPCASDIPRVTPLGSRDWPRHESLSNSVYTERTSTNAQRPSSVAPAH